MKKSLLFSMMALGVSLSASAFEANEYVYAPQGRFMILSADNLCTNGTCASNFDGWTAISASADNTAADIFQYDSDKQSMYSKTNAVGEGMYYKFNLPDPSGTYIVSVKLRQETVAYPYTTNVYYTTADELNTLGVTGTAAAGHNYLSVFGNVGGFDNGKAKNEEFVSYGTSVLLTTDWNTATYAIVGDGTIRDYYIAMAQMDPTVEIADIQIQSAVQVADLRVRDAAVAYAETILNAKEWADSEELDALMENIEACKSDITDETSADELNEFITGLNEALTAADGTGFLDKCADNFLASCKAGTIWSQNTTKYQKMTSIGDWQLSNARWFHCNNNDAAEREKLKEFIDGPNFGYSNGMLGEQYCKMTKSLMPGTYIFAMDGKAHTMYKSNVVAAGTASNYLYNRGLPTGQMTLYVKDADGNEIAANTIALPVEEFATNIIVANVEEAGDYEIGVSLFQQLDGYDIEGICKGGSYTLQKPRLYCSLSGQYNATELKYIEDVKAQITALESNLATAQGLLEDTGKPWLKQEMTDTIAKYTEYLAYYQALSDDDIYNGFVDPVSQVENNGYANYIDGENPETGAAIPTYNAIDSVMNNTVKKVIRFCETYNSANAVFPALKTAIANAQTVLDDRLYASASGRDALVAAIADAQAVYDNMAADGSYDLTPEAENADFATVQNAANELATAVDEFKTTVSDENVTNIVDIDFSNPAVLNDETGAYSIDGNNGSMTIVGFTETTDGSNNFELGIDSNGEKVLADVLRVGNSEAVVEFAAPVNGSDLVRFQFDYYFGSLINRNCGFYIRTAEDADICGLYISKYSGTAVVNTFDIDFNNQITSLGSSSVSGAAICVESNKTHFDIILDYGAKKMYSTITSPKGTFISEKVDLPELAPAKFVVKSDYNVEARRSWFDNLVIDNISAGPTAVNGVVEVAPAANNGAIYNVAGQQISAPVKGQIYIKNGAAFVK